MKQRSFLSKRLILVGVVMCCLTPVLAQDAQLRQEIEAANRKLMEAEDAASIAALYTRDAQVFPPNMEPVIGSEAIGAFFAGGGGSVDLRTLEVERAGDTAYELGAYTFHDDAGQAVDQGRYVVIWKKEDGRWKLHRDMWNSSRPTQTGAEGGDALKRAGEGEEVRIAIYRVRPEKRAAFETFVHDVLVPAAFQTQPDVSERVRFWTAEGPQEDGTYHYAFVFDPYVETGDYSIASILEKVHGKEKAQQYTEDFRTYIEGYIYTPFVQSK